MHAVAADGILTKELYEIISQQSNEIQELKEKLSCCADVPSSDLFIPDVLPLHHPTAENGVDPDVHLGLLHQRDLLREHVNELEAELRDSRHLALERHRHAQELESEIGRLVAKLAEYEQTETSPTQSGLETPIPSIPKKPSSTFISSHPPPPLVAYSLNSPVMGPPPANLPISGRSISYEAELAIAKAGLSAANLDLSTSSSFTPLKSSPGLHLTPIPGVPISFTSPPSATSTRTSDNETSRDLLEFLNSLEADYLNDEKIKFF